MKRFTATEKWTDHWFSGLSSTAKLVLFYIWDNCDWAGVWEANYRDAESKLNHGASVDWKSIFEEINRPVQRISLGVEESEEDQIPRVMLLKGGKWWMTKFIAFQWGLQLKAAAPFHRAVITCLNKHGITETFLDLFKGAKIIADPSKPKPAAKPKASESIWEMKERLKGVEERIEELLKDTVIPEGKFHEEVRPESVAKIKELRALRDELKEKIIKGK